MKVDNKYLRFAVYALGFSVSSEILYRAFLLLVNYSKKKKQDRSVQNVAEINHALISNELTEKCMLDHEKNMKPCKNEHCYIKNLNRIIELIDNAEKNIDLAMYMFTMLELSEAFIRAFKRGIKIRIICDESMALNDSSQIVVLCEAGISIRVQKSEKKYMHHKVCIIDGPQETGFFGNLKNNCKSKDQRPKSFLLVGSANWTFQGLSNNWDSIIITSNVSLINTYQMEFNRIWNSTTIKSKTQASSKLLSQ